MLRNPRAFPLLGAGILSVMFNKTAWYISFLRSLKTNIMNMELSVLAISIFGIFIFLSISFSYISAKTIDGFGKSYYSLIPTALKIVLIMILISLLRQYLPKGISVLVSILICEIMMAVIYYVVLKFLFKRFESTDKEDLKVV